MECKNELDLLKQLQQYEHIIKVYQYIIQEEKHHTFQIFIVMELAQFTLSKEI